MFGFRDTLIDYFHNVRAAEKVGYYKPENTYISWGYWSFENFVVYRKDNTRIKVAHGEGLFDGYEITVTIEDILVYESGWIHSVPKKMKDHVFSIVKELKSYNKDCKSEKIHKQLKQLIEQKRLRDEEKKAAKFKEESDKLKSIFK